MDGGDPVGGAAASPVAAFLAPHDTRDGPVPVPDQQWFEDDVRWRETGRSFVPAAVRGWFANGGRDCVLLPMDWTGSGADPLAAVRGAPGRGLAALDQVPDVDLVLFPDAALLATRGDQLDLGLLAELHLELLASCEAVEGRIAVIDAPPGLDVRGVFDWRVEIAGYDSAAGVLYYPWILVASGGSVRSVPPCGHVAASHRRIDARAAVGPVNMRLEDALDTVVDVAALQVDLLQPVGINVLRSFTRWGVRAWGSRTLSSDPYECDLVAVRARRALIAEFDREWAHAREELAVSATDDVIEQVRNRLQAGVDEWMAVLRRRHRSFRALSASVELTPTVDDAGQVSWQCSVPFEETDEDW